jgi:hypothetical protein
MAKSDIKSLIKASGAKMSPPKADLISETLKRRLDEIELLAERIGQTDLLTDAATEYFRESTKELEHLRWYRMATMIVAAGLLVFLLILLTRILFYHQVWFYLQGPITRSSLIIGTLGGSIILMTVILKGVFKASSDRSKDDGLPEHLKAALEIVKLSSGALKS